MPSFMTTVGMDEAALFIEEKVAMVVLVIMRNFVTRLRALESKMSRDLRIMQRNSGSKFC